MSTIDYSFPVDFRKAANCRTLVGLVSAVHDDNTVDVLVLGAVVANMPTHYHCSHQVVTHAARVFLQGDDVLVHYTGEGSAPSASNCKVVGFCGGYLRDCKLFGGIIASSYSGPTVASVVDLGDWPGVGNVRLTAWRKSAYGAKYLLEGESVTPSSLSVTARSDWYGAGHRVLWVWGPHRYARLGVTSSGKVWLDGEELDTPVASVQGACVRVIGEDRWLFVFGSNSLYKKNITVDGAWLQHPLAGQAYGLAGAPVFFTSTGDNAYCCINQAVYTISINNDAWGVTVRATYAEQLDPSGSGIKVEERWTELVDAAASLIEAQMVITREPMNSSPADGGGVSYYYCPPVNETTVVSTATPPNSYLAVPPGWSPGDAAAAATEIIRHKSTTGCDRWLNDCTVTLRFDTLSVLLFRRELYGYSDTTTETISSVAIKSRTVQKNGDRQNWNFVLGLDLRHGWYATYGRTNDTAPAVQTVSMDSASFQYENATVYQTGPVETTETLMTPGNLVKTVSGSVIKQVSYGEAAGFATIPPAQVSTILHNSPPKLLLGVDTGLNMAQHPDGSRLVSWVYSDVDAPYLHYSKSTLPVPAGSEMRIEGML